jgi:hypothetical protein
VNVKGNAGNAADAEKPFLLNAAGKNSAKDIEKWALNR